MQTSIETLTHVCEHIIALRYHSLYTYYVRVGAGNDLQLLELLDFEGTETVENHILNLPGTFLYNFFLIYGVGEKSPYTDQYTTII
jgi:hypothetical protein